MNRLQSNRNAWRTIVGPLLAIALAAPALAVLLPPGGAVFLPGAAMPGGVIVHDALAPFQITDASGTDIFEGVLHDRVIRKPDGTHVFARRFRDSLVDVPAAVVSALVTNFTGVSTDVDYDPFGPGTNFPNLVTRTSDGSLLRYDFSIDPINETEESRWFYADTDALGFTVAGTLTVVADSGETTEIIVASPVADDTPPIAEITDPLPFTCVCDPATISGIADDPDNTYLGHLLEYREVNSASWTLIGSSSTPVPAPGGPLFVWSTTALPQGYYFLRLTVENTAGLTSSDITIVWVDQQFDTLSYTTPAANSVVGGLVCPGGILDDHCAEQFSVEYAPQGGGTFQPIDLLMPVYNGPKINQTFAVWDTIGQGIPDGDYVLRVTAFDDCGFTATDSRNVTVDNTPPTAEIAFPVNCQCVDGVIEVLGTADDANLASWVLQYTGGNQNGWVTIASGSAPVINGVLGTWDTTGLLTCPHTLRLLVSDSAIVDCNGAIHHQSVHLVSVNVGCDECQGDVNHDGVIDIGDLLIVLGFWGACP
ncbi:MAG: hypothetical protein ACYTG1_02770 [Planctomycetota bacterium]|jgi:hypothetical protein